MNTHKSKLTFKFKHLTFIFLSCASLPTWVMANSELEQLKLELNELKQLVQQMNVQQQQQSVVLNHVQGQQKSSSISENIKNTLGVTKSGTEVHLYGNVRLDGLYQIDGGNLARLYNQINTVPLKGDQSSTDQFKSSLAATRLGLDFITKTAIGDVGGKIEVDFLGANDTLRLRHGYLTYGNWLIGQTWSNFAVPDYMPESIDALGYVGGAIKRDPQVRYTQKFSPATNLVVALEDPKDDTSRARLPALSARLNHQFNDDFIVTARAMVNEKKTADDHETAWGVGLGTKYDLFENTSFKADFYHVKGDSSFIPWTNKGFLVNANNEIVATNKFHSITVGLTQKINSNLRTTLGYGYMKSPDNKQYIDALADPTSANKSLWQAWANIFYSPVKPITYGLEYVYGERKAFKPNLEGNDKGIDNRFNFVVMYNF